MVLGDLTVQQRKSEGSGAIAFCDEVKRALTQMDIPFTAARDTAVEKGALEGHKVAIFPYSAVWSDAEVQQVLNFVEAGGKLVTFYTVPPELAAVLGIKLAGLRKQKVPGELYEVRFNDECPANFPSSFVNTSHASMIAQLLPNTQAIADWYGADGKPLGIPAVTLGPAGFYMGHVFKGSDFIGHKAYLLSAIGHVLPHVWEKAVSATLAQCETVGRFTSPEALRDAFVERQIPLPPELEQAMARRAAAKQCFENKHHRQALEAAGAAGSLLKTAYACLFPSRGSELRACWLSYPTNLDWEEVMQQLAAARFNAVFPLMCSAGIAYYDSDILPRAETAGDQLALCCKWASEHDIEVHVWRINWQVHGASKDTVKSLQEQRRCIVEFADAESRTMTPQRILCPTDPRNRKLEQDAMLEVVRKYPIHGIQYDYMRYGGEDQCFCDGCKDRFGHWQEQEVQNWPKDCFGAGALAEAYLDWRTEVMTETVRDISQAIHALRPEVRVSLAARTAAWPQRRKHDAQHWEDWVRKRYLDFLCPMDYTPSLDQLRRWVSYQADVVDGSMPLYAGLGTTYNARLGDARIASDEVQLARELGADGYVIFCWNQALADFIPALGRGVNRDKASQPHRSPWVQFEFPPGLDGLPKATYGPEAELHVRMKAEAASPLKRTVQHIGGTVVSEYADGTTSLPLTRFQTSTTTGRAFRVPTPPGSARLRVTGTVTYTDGGRSTFVCRSRPFRVLSQDEMAEIQRRADPPTFTGSGVKVAILSGTYGAKGLLTALSETPGIEAKLIHHLSESTIAPCDVLLVPQPRREASALTAAATDVLRQFVNRGSGLLVTHDLVGYRGAPVLFPRICVRGSDHRRQTECFLTEATAKRLELEAGSCIPHSYFDHIVVEPGPDAWIAASDADGNAVVVAGDSGKGRFVANGMASGLSPRDDDVPPQGRERELLVELVKWLARK